MGLSLDVRNVKVYFKVQKGLVKAVDDVSFKLEKGKSLGLVGESGCGKTTTAFTIMNLLPSNGKIVLGSVTYGDEVIGQPMAGALDIVEGALGTRNWWKNILYGLTKEAESIERFQAEMFPGEVIEPASLAAGSPFFFIGKKPRKELIKFDLSVRIGLYNIVMNVIEDSKKYPIADPVLEKSELPYFKKKMLTKITDRRTYLRHRLFKLTQSMRVKNMVQKRKIILGQKIREVRWKDISIIFQSAMNAFNPVQKIGDQILEAILTHENITKKEGKERVYELFKLVGMDPQRYKGYPHEFSGGMRQRAMIAMALACGPSFIIADEPTTALDVIMQDRILMEIKKLQKKLNLSLIIITHDISVVAETANKIAVMYAGKIFEYGDISDIFTKTSNPYTIGLLSAFPSIRGPKKKLESIPGSPPDLVQPPKGCRFHPRCKFAKEICSAKEPEPVEIEPGHTSLCHFAREIFQSRREG